MTRLTDSEKYLRFVNTLHGRLSELLKGARHTAKQRQREFNLEYHDLARQWRVQKGRCVYTGWEMSTFRGDPRLVSIERVDNAVGYVPGNVILVCWCANRARNTLTIQQFVEMCEAVVAFNTPPANAAEATDRQQ